MGLDPVASSPYRMSLGNLPSCMSVTWPSQRRRLLVSRAYVLRNYGHLAHKLTHTESSCPCWDLGVGDKILPGDAEDPSEAVFCFM